MHNYSVGKMELSSSLQELIKGFLGQDKSTRRFRTVYNLLKQERKELDKLESIEAYNARNCAHDWEGIVTFIQFTYMPDGDGL